MNTKNKLSSYPMKELAPVICEFLSEGKEVIVSARGNSMRPLLRNQKDNIKLVAYRNEDLNVGDMVFYKRETGRYVLHRITDISSDGSFTLMGDCQVMEEKGIKKEDVIALPVAIIRGKRYISCKFKGYRIYAKFWAKSVFFRKLHSNLFHFTVKVLTKLKQIKRSPG